MTQRRYVLPSEYWKSDESVTVEHIEVVGNKHTKEDVFGLYLGDVQRARGGNELHAALARAREGLMRLCVFRSLEFVLDAARQERATRIAVLVDEADRKELTAGVTAGSTGDLVFSGSVAMLNAFGRGETWRVGGTVAAPGSREATTLEGSFRKPLLWARGPPQAWTLQGQFYETDRYAESAHLERVARVAAAYHYGDVTLRLASALTRLSGDPRPVAAHPNHPRPSLANREQFGWTPKTTLGLEWSRDSRDDPLAPTRGAWGRALLELAADPERGRLLFLKGELAGTISAPLAPGWSVSLRGRVGHLAPLSGGSAEAGHRHPAATSADAFHLGGADRVAGFCQRGIGRSAGGESLGVLSYWLAALHLSAALPAAPDFLRAHAHATLCGAAGLIGGGPEQHGLAAVFRPEALRASVGLGLVAALPGTGRLTFTVSHILRQQQGDGATGMMQVGFTTSFE
jgi:outer membrane protein insertion porin family